MLTNAFQDRVRATDGPVHASFPEETDDPLPTAWVDALAALGYPASGDPFSGEFTGAYINTMSMRHIHVVTLSPLTLSQQRVAQICTSWLQLPSKRSCLGKQRILQMLLAYSSSITVGLQ